MAPPRKKEKKGEDISLSSDGAHSGIIRFEVDKIYEMEEWEDGWSRDSPLVEVGGVPWKAEVNKKCTRHNRRRQLYELRIALFCLNDHSSLASIEVDVDFIIVHSDGTKNKTFKKHGLLDDILKNISASTLDWDDVFGEGFDKGDKITVEIRFSITNTWGVRIVPCFDFTDPNEPLHDVALMIGGEKIYANKGILASHSPVFYAMFYGDFAEKDKKEIELKDVNREEFLEMLHVIYPSNKKITENSAEYLIKLGDRFQITSVIDSVEQCLITASEDYTSKIPKQEMEQIANQYRLFRLKGAERRPRGTSWLGNGRSGDASPLDRSTPSPL